jgi:hypothetical protein
MSRYAVLSEGESSGFYRCRRGKGEMHVPVGAGVESGVKGAVLWRSSVCVRATHLFAGEDV